MTAGVDTAEAIEQNTIGPQTSRHGLAGAKSFSISTARSAATDGVLAAIPEPNAMRTLQRIRRAQTWRHL